MLADMLWEHTRNTMIIRELLLLKVNAKIK